MSVLALLAGGLVVSGLGQGEEDMNHVVVGRGGGRNTLSVERERNGLIAKCVTCTEFSVNNLVEPLISDPLR